jgi:hypothetical protein
MTAPTIGVNPLFNFPRVPGAWREVRQHIP